MGFGEWALGDGIKAIELGENGEARKLVLLNQMARLGSRVGFKQRSGP
jgi:hypothetical protein